MKHFRKKTFLTITFLIGFGSFIHAQEQKAWQWVNQLGGGSWDISGGIICNSKNDLVVAGSFLNTLAYENIKLTTSGSQDIFIARFDTKGTLKDLCKCGGDGSDMVTCITHSNESSTLIGGVISGDVSFDKISSNGKGSRLFVTRLSEKGKFSWVSTLTTTGEASLFLIDADARGNIVTAGVFSGNLTGGNCTITSNGRKDIFMAKLNTFGNVEKLIALGGEEDDIPTALSVSDSGKVVLAAMAGKTFTYGDFEFSATKQNSTLSIKSNAFILSFNNNFEPQWKIQINGEEYCRIAAVGQDSQENLYVTGDFNLDIKVEGNQITSNGYCDNFLLKYTPNGKLIWSKGFGTCYYDYVNHLIIDNLSGIILTGSIGDTLTVDNLTINPISENNSALVIQFSPEGQAIWADCISGSGRNFSSGAALDREGNLYLTGTFRDAFFKENNSLVSHGDQDVFLAKYQNCPTVGTEIVGETLMCEGTTIQLSVAQSYTQVIWNDTIKNTNYILVTAPGTYRVSMLDKHGCLVYDTLEVTSVPASLITLGDDTSLPLEGSLLLKAPENYTDYRWQDGSTENTFLAQAISENPGIYTYSLVAVDSTGCTVSDTIKIDFYVDRQWLDPDSIQLYVYPNPVSDLLTWSLNTEKQCQFVIEIADDNGRIIYYEHVKNYHPGTNMTVNFSDVLPGSYYFRLKDNTGKALKNVCIIRK